MANFRSRRDERPRRFTTQWPLVELPATASEESADAPRRFDRATPPPDEPETTSGLGNFFQGGCDFLRTLIRAPLRSFDEDPCGSRQAAGR